MSNNWVGYMVSVSCKHVGTYQGQITAVTGTTMTLAKAFLNGTPHRDAQVVITATDILDLKLIDSQPNSTNGQSTVTVAKPVAKRAGRSVSVSECTTSAHSNNNSSNKQCTVTQQQHQQQQQYAEQQQKNGANTSLTNQPSVVTLKTPKWGKKWRDEAAFGTTMDHSIQQDFDFEKNLALFNKEAVWQEINASQKPDVVHQTDTCRRQQIQKYRHDENVIATLPTAFRQITVPAPDQREYVTDDGLVIPSVTQELRRQLFAAAEKRGLTVDRQTELMGRAATEMALQLLGGGHRLNPHNTHQWPNVVVLCGPHRQGAIGVNCARQLSSHGVNTIVHVAAADGEAAVMKTELGLYKLSKSRVSVCVAGLPPTADLIILALCDDSDSPCAYPLVAEWVNQNRAPVLALDPPAVGTPGVVTKFSLLPVLPLSHSPGNGKLYLCNLAFPAKVFRDIGIKYRSPFGPKFVIPLHPNDT